jgi:uncharacterized protein YabE (DUF348 family)
MAVREKAWEGGKKAPVQSGPRYARGFLAIPVFGLLVALLIVGYQRTLISVHILLDGQERTLRTHQTTVEAVLREAGFLPNPEDIVTPALSEHLVGGATITVQRARAVTVVADGQATEARTQLAGTQEILASLGVPVGQHDRVQVTAGEPVDTSGDSPLLIQIQRAVPVTILEGDKAPLHLYTTASSVGELLHEAGFVLFLADEVRPPLSSPIRPDDRISVKRSVPVTIVADGHSLRTRTHRTSVGDVLADAGITLQGLDYAEPALDAALGGGAEIRVVRVREEVLVQQETIPFETQWAPDPELEIDHQRVGQDGQVGIFERRIRVRYEGGQEVDRWLDAEWMARQPSPKIYNYGTKIVLRSIDTPSGTVQYWRKFRMLATSYNAASAGKSPDHPRYGITRLGWQMRYGIVAVDPNIIRLGSRVYVPGYGVGDAADTGGAISNLRIDLGYDDDNLVSWYRCVDVYLLAPVPSSVDYLMSSLVHPWCR